MNYTVQFEDVSKKYQLGMTRRSVPSLLYDLTRNTLNHFRRVETGKDQTLWAVRNVSFQLERGESLALIGPNGAGKTTILKLLAQITKPTAGDIKINGKLSALIELGAGFHPDLSGRENIYLNGVILGLKKKEIGNLFDEIVAFSELDNFIDTPVKRYSSGMAVRLGFSVAASIKPDILLVDEVLAVGDISFRLKCVQRIEELIKNGTSLIFVSHNTGLIKAVCKKSIYIDHGKVVYYGSTDEAINVYNRALNEIRIKQYDDEEIIPSSSDGTIEITDVKLIRSGNPSEANLKTDQPAKIEVGYVAYADIDNVRIVLRIIRTDGISCSILYSKVDKVQIHIKRGSGVISAQLNPLQLFPGVYYVAATIKNHDETITYALGRSDWLEVQGTATGYEDRDAVFEPNRQWEHQISV